METVIILCVIGLATGTLGAMLGVGGSILLIPALNEFRGLHQHAHQATAMITTFFVAAPAAWRYGRAGLVDRGVAASMVPAAAMAVMVGVACSESAVFRGAGEGRLAAVFGVFLLAVTVQNVVRLCRAETAPPAAPSPASGSRRRGGLLIGATMGFVGGLLGVGGGLIAVPLQQMVLGLPLKRAIANSTLLICVVGVIGALHKNWAWARQHAEQALEPLTLAMVLIPTVMIGSLLGSSLTTVLPTRSVRWAFGAVLLVAGIRQLYRGLGLGGQ